MTFAHRKVLFLLRSLDCGGAERQFSALIRELHRRGRPVSVAVLYPGGPFQEELESAGVRVLSLEKRGRWDVIGFVRRLRELVRQERPDVVHSCLVIPNLTAVFLRLFRQELRVVWGVRDSNIDMRAYDWLERLAWSLECRLSSLADLVISNSHSGLEYSVRHGFPRERMIVVPNGIDGERFRPNAELRRTTRESLGIRDGETLIGIVGRLDPMKDYPCFLQAAARLSKVKDGVRFLCAGDGPEVYRRKLEELTRELQLEGKVLWLPATKQVAGLYNALDILTSTSAWGEGFSNVLAEGMACGVRVVATDAGDSRHIVADCGIVVPPGSPDAVTDAWLRMLDGGHTHEPERARARITDQFSIPALGNRTEEALWTMA